MRRTGQPTYPPPPLETMPNQLAQMVTKYNASLINGNRIQPPDKTTKCSHSFFVQRPD